MLLESVLHYSMWHVCADRGCFMPAQQEPSLHLPTRAAETFMSGDKAAMDLPLILLGYWKIERREVFLHSEDGAVSRRTCFSSLSPIF